MNEFLDRVLLMQAPPVTSTITCDTDGCQAAIVIPNDIDEAQAAATARAAGWTAQMGVHRWAHHCPRHSEVKR